MKQNIIWTPKFKVGNVIKYFGDIYEITGINQYGYDVNAIEYRDQEEVKTGLGRNVEHIMEFIAEHHENKEKKFYPVFRIDVCFTGYAMDYVLVGAESLDDLIAHIHDILTDDDIDYGTASVDELASETSRFEEVKNMYTDKPYTVLDSYSYYE